jgi:hypothetical protein
MAKKVQYTFTFHVDGTEDCTENRALFESIKNNPPEIQSWIETSLCIWASHAGLIEDFKHRDKPTFTPHCKN